MALKIQAAQRLFAFAPGSSNDDDDGDLGERNMLRSAAAKAVRYLRKPGMGIKVGQDTNDTFSYIFSMPAYGDYQGISFDTDDLQAFQQAVRQVAAKTKGEFLVIFKPRGPGKLEIIFTLKSKAEHDAYGD